MTKADSFIKICKNQEQSVVEFGSKAYREKVERKTKALISIIKTIILLVKQNIAFRGKTEEKGNFRALINYRAEVDTFL